MPKINRFFGNQKSNLTYEIHSQVHSKQFSQ